MIFAMFFFSDGVVQYCNELVEDLLRRDTIVVSRTFGGCAAEGPGLIPALRGCMWRKPIRFQGSFGAHTVRAAGAASHGSGLGPVNRP